MRSVITDVLSRRLGGPVQIAVVVNVPEDARSPGRPAYSREPAPNPEPEPMVTRGVRLPASLDQRMREAADQAGVPFSQLIREWIELGLADMDDEQVVSLATLRRAIAHAAHSTANRPSP
jgi:predicted DNA-binding protein